MSLILTVMSLNTNKTEHLPHKKKKKISHSSFPFSKMPVYIFYPLKLLFIKKQK